MVFYPSTGTWTNRPPGPLPDMTSAGVAWAGNRLIVVAKNGDTGRTR